MPRILRVRDNFGPSLFFFVAPSSISTLGTGYLRWHAPIHEGRFAEGFLLWNDTPSCFHRTIERSCFAALDCLNEYSLFTLHFEIEL